MATISLLARLVTLSTNAVSATSANLTDWEIVQTLDRAGSLMVEAFASEPGNAAGGGTSFATYLLNGGTGAAGNSAPVATLLELSLDGGTLYDSRKVVEAPRRLLRASGPVIQESGSDIWSQYATLGIDRATFTNVYLCDALYQTSGSIKTIIPATPTRTGSAGALSWKVTNVTHGVESTPSLASATAALGAVVTVPVGGGGTTARRLYRNSIAYPAIWRLTTTVIGNAAATYTDSNSDASIAGNPQPPQQYGFFSATGAIPILQGIFGTIPGLASWAAGAQTRLTFTPVIDNTTGLAFLQTNLDLYAYYIGKATEDLARKLGGAFAAADDVTKGSRGHFVADGSDGALNLSSSFAGVVCDGSPTFAAPAGTNGYSNDAGRGGGVSRAVVIGALGSSPGGAAFTFDGSSNAPLLPSQEATTARIYQDAVTITPSLQNYYQQASFIGGQTNGAGLPPGFRLTSLVTLGNTAGDDAVTTCLPVVGITVGDVAGGVYYTIGDNQFVPWPQSPNLPVYDMTVDPGSGTLYIATPAGVYARNTTLADRTTAWTRVGTGGGLKAKVTRLSGVTVSGTFYLYALASGNAKGIDGVYRFPAATGSPTGAGYDGWSFWLPSGGQIIDMIATDDHSFFFLHKADNGNHLLLYDVTAHTTTPYDLPAGVSGSHLDRVITAAAGPAPAQDSVWVVTVGDNQPAYYLLYSAGWGAAHTALQKGNLDLSLYGVGGSKLVTVNRFTAGHAFNGVNAAVLCCCSNGLFYLPQGTGIPAGGAVGWVSLNAGNGLDGVNVLSVAAGQTQNLRGTPTSTHIYDIVAAQRVFGISPDGFYDSSSIAAFWRNVTKEPLAAGPFFTALAYDISGALPTNSLLTIGPMASSPLGGPSGTHLSAAVLPAGWYWLRQLDERYAWTWRLVNSNVALPGLMYHPVATLQANSVVTLLSASAQLATVMFAWLKDNSQPQTLMVVESSFTQDTAGLRKLRPTMAVQVTLSESLLAKAAGAGAVTTPVVSMSAQTWYVLEHRLRKGDASGTSVRTTTTLGTQLKTQPIGPDDIAAALLDRLGNVQRFGLAPA